MRIENKTTITTKGNKQQKTRYDYNYIEDLENFEKVWREEQKNHNIEKCYFAVSLWGEELARFDNLKKAKEFAIKDYEDLKEDAIHYGDNFGVDSLKDYIISINIITKPREQETYNQAEHYIYEFDIENI